MNKPDVKKLILLNLPYVFAFYFADKIAAVFRLAPGAEFIDKLTNGFAVFGTAFTNPLPSFHLVDLLIGLIAGALLKLAVYVKGKNRKKFRQGEEYETMIDDLLTMSEIIQMVTDVRTKDASFIQKFAEFMPAYAEQEKNRLAMYRDAAKEAEDIFDRWADEFDDLDEDYEPDEFFSD